jgi:hypothetical protein
MQIEFSDFVIWLNCRYDTHNNRFVISEINNMIKRTLDSLNLKIIKDDFINQLTSFIYQYSSGSKVSKPYEYLNEYTEEKEYFDIHYLQNIRDLYREINEYIDFYRFNILDVNRKTLELNFVDFIFQNIEINLPEENENDDGLEDNEYDYY